MTKLKAASSVKWTQINCVIGFLFCRTYSRSYRIGVANAVVKQLVQSSVECRIIFHVSVFFNNTHWAHQYWMGVFKLLLVDMIPVR